MSLTLGEKLRQAREDRGYSISEVSEQTRISPLYLESIENNDYSILPGGIFNKGFVKSYAKFVGINEQEALFEYSELISASETAQDDEPRRYRSEVLTDDTGPTMLPTIIVALLILGVMTALVLLGLRYLRHPETVAENAPPVNTAETANANTETPSENTPGPVPDMENLTVEFAATSEPVSLTATTDGKVSTSIVEAGTSKAFEPKESLKLSYSRSLASFVQLTMNGKQIALPEESVVPKRNVIEFEINRSNLADIWTNGAITSATPSIPVETSSSGSTPGSTMVRPAAQPKQTAEPRPPASTAPRTSPSPRPSVRPPATFPRPVANRT